MGRALTPQKTYNGNNLQQRENFGNAVETVRLEIEGSRITKNRCLWYEEVSLK